ncbi:hypothetical protein [Nitrobacter sp. JJSN]|uniref:hypothetical protein n=1 Tax=Nitrobacter sp. JJSN TaxID=3453033 RepID=UPI003F75994A
MDFNLSRRKRELAIAKEVTDAFLQATNAAELAPPEKLMHHFVLVCERLGITPNAPAISRILAYTSKEINRRKRVLDDLVTALNRLPAPELQL